MSEVAPLDTPSTDDPTGTPIEGHVKVYVCKYVGTPGVDERLQTGQNPIEVSMNATAGTWFNDAQGRSYVIGVVGEVPEPVTRDDCPAPEGPGTTAPETTAPETTVPETTAPETTAPETTAPGTTPPGTSAPGTSPATTAPAVPIKPERPHAQPPRGGSTLPDRGDDGLATTGADLTMPLIGATLLLSSGALVMALRRRRDVRE